MALLRLIIAVVDTEKGQERGTKSFHRWDKHKRRITEGFQTISWEKKRLSTDVNFENGPSILGK